MTKSKTKQPDRLKVILIAVIALLTITTVAFGMLYAKERKNNEEPTSQKAVNVSLGAFEYSFANDKATKRNDETTKSLKEFLVKTAQKDVELGCETAHYNVVASSRDETQILLNYGCEYPNAHMFAVRDGQLWKTISPTNQFDNFGISRCNYLDQYKISREISPVCTNVDEQSGSATYLAR